MRSEDGFVAGFPGVFDVAESQLYPINPDLNYLDATIEGGFLNIGHTYTRTSGDIIKVEFYLDTDQNPATGEIRAGHMGGFEYRVDAFSSLFNDWILVRLPVTDAEAERGETQVNTLPQSQTIAANGLRIISIPLSWLGNPERVDVVAYGWVGGAVPGDTSIAAAGDRLPNFGAFNTATRQVVVRRPAATVLRRVGRGVLGIVGIVGLPVWRTGLRCGK